MVSVTTGAAGARESQDRGAPPARRYRLVAPARRGGGSPTTVDLDEIQRRVVDHERGPLLVVGGPGTGKTTTLVEAVAARVAGGVAPDRIAVFTFGRRGAVRLRVRIEARIATGGAPLAITGEPLVRTFHGYAFGLLRRAAVRAGDPPPRLLTGPEQDMVIRELISGGGSDGGAVGWPERLRGAVGTMGFAAELRDLLLRCAERGIGPSGLAALAAIHDRPEWDAAARFYSEYLQVLALRDAGGRGTVAYDYAELVRVATALLREDPELLAAERRRLRFIYVDEFADTDPAQADLLDAVAGHGGNLVAFADPDSSVFGFRGADPTIVADFPSRFRAPDGREGPKLVLNRSYRSERAIVAASRRVAARLRGPSQHRRLDVVEPVEGLASEDSAGAAPATGPSPVGPTVDARVFRAETRELWHVASRLREARLLGGVPWSRMAVIVRSASSRTAPVRLALRQAGVPVATQAVDLPIRLRPAVRPLLLAMACAIDPERLDEDAAVTLLRSPLGGADPLAERAARQGLAAVAVAAGDRRPSGLLLVEALLRPASLRHETARWADPVRAVASAIAAARDAVASADASPEEALWRLWTATGLAKRWSAASAVPGPVGEAADRDLDAVLTLFEAAASFTDRLPGAGPGVFLDYLTAQEVPADSIALGAEPRDAVRVLTAHAAKGMEWDVVAVVGVQEGVWPDLRLRGTVLGSERLVDIVAGRDMEDVGRLSALLDEERRLFYVAVTRARRALIVTAAAGGDDGEAQPSRFLTELTGKDGSELRADTGEPARRMTLPALIAQLRRAATDQAEPESRRAWAAAMLRRIADAGVPSADPDRWWGLSPLSDARPLAAAGELVTVTPSTVAGVSRCALRWLLERNGGAPPASPEQGIGNLVHAAAMLATAASVDRAELAAYVAERFHSIELSARWLVGRERHRVDDMLDKLLAWIATNPRRLIGIEREFLVKLFDPDAPVAIRGRVDRLEIDELGRLVVVDLKTGRSTPVGAEIAEHAQLAAYQVAIEAGAFGDGQRAGGAALVQLGGAAKAAREQTQPPLSDADDPAWAGDLIRRTAKTMAAATFEAVASSSCRVCPVRTSCPISSKGRQVIA